GHVEVSMTEAAIGAFPWPVLVEAAGAGPVVAEGNRDPLQCPHGTFHCRGDDRSIAVVCRSDAEFAAPAPATREPCLTDRVPTLADRKAHEDELEALVAAWAAGQDVHEAAAALRAAGVGAEVVADMSEVAADPVLQQRGFMLHHDHPEI